MFPSATAHTTAKPTDWHKKLGKNDPDTLSSVNNLGSLLQDHGKFDEAEPLLRRAMEGNEATLGAKHVNTTTSMGNLGLLLQGQGKIDEAKALSGRALEIDER